MTSGAGTVATAMRVLNAVPYVVAAHPGLLSSVVLALTIASNAFVRQRLLRVGARPEAMAFLRYAHQE
jgi:hypothetical protein